MKPKPTTTIKIDFLDLERKLMNSHMSNWDADLRAATLDLSPGSTVPTSPCLTTSESRRIIYLSSKQKNKISSGKAYAYKNTHLWNLTAYLNMCGFTEVVKSGNTLTARCEAGKPEGTRDTEKFLREQRDKQMREMFG